MKIHAIRLLPGDDLKHSVEIFTKQNSIHAGAIMTCVGSLKRLCLRMANSTDLVVKEEKFEIVSLVGTLSSEGSHLHVSLSDRNGIVTGGHLMPGNIVFTTAEIVIAELPDIVFSRQHDEGTGYKELSINKK